MLTKKIANNLNEQLNKEFYSAYLYLAMSAHCSMNDLKGAAHWFMLQYQEEVMHGTKIYNYMIDHGVHVALEAIDKPPVEFGSLLETFESALKHERYMTDMINELSDIALKEKDYATYNLLQWYVSEQVEEEASVGDIISKLKIVKDDGYGLLMIDNELARRVVSPLVASQGLTPAAP